MKRLFLLSSLVASVMFCNYAQESVIVYDGEQVKPTWVDLEATVSEVDNPDKDGINPSERCMSIVRRGESVEGNGKQTFSGGRLYDLDIDPYYFNRISMLVKKQTNGPVKIELQRMDGNAEVDKDGYTVEYTGGGEWQKLVFDIKCRTIKVNNLLVLIHDTAVPADMEETMYWDDVTLYWENDYPVKDSIMTLYNGEDANFYWGDLAATVNRDVENPDKTGINTSDHCVSVLRTNTGTEPNGVQHSGGALFGCERMRINPAEYNRLSVMVLKGIAGPVTLELQKDGVDNRFVTAQYTEEEVGKWQQLVFDISGSTEEIHRLLIRPHDTQDGLTAEGTLMYWDNVIAYYEENTSTNSHVIFDEESVIETVYYNIMGKYVGTGLDETLLPNGIYIVKETDSNGAVRARKIQLWK